MIFYGAGRVNFWKPFTGDSKEERKKDADFNNRHAGVYLAGIHREWRSVQVEFLVDPG
jgi:hypothetical protein